MPLPVSLLAKKLRTDFIEFIDSNGNFNGSLDIVNNSLILTLPNNQTINLSNTNNYDLFTGNTGSTYAVKLGKGETGIFEVTPVRFEGQTGISGVFSSDAGVSSSQKTNVLSYDNNSNEITYRNLGLYNDKITTVTGITNGVSDDDYRIISNYSIIPKIHGVSGGRGLSLGNRGARWQGVYTSELFISTDTIYVEDSVSGETMALKFDPKTLTTTVVNQEKNISVNTVTTSLNAPGQIDANLLPFTGLSFIDNFNPVSYFETFGNNFDIQTLFLIYTRKLKSIQNVNELQNFTIPTTTRTNAVFQSFSGSYFKIAGLPEGQTRELNFSTLVATTNLTEFDRGAAGVITTPFTSVRNSTYYLANNDMLTFTVRLTKDENEEFYKLELEWTQVQFKVPLSGIGSSNIIDNAIMNRHILTNAVDTRTIQDESIISSKLASNSVTNIHLQNSSINNDKILNNTISLSKLTPELQRLVAGISNNVSADIFNSLLTEVNVLKSNVENMNQQITNLTNKNTQLEDINKKWESKFLAIDEFIHTMMKTYTINYLPNETYTYTSKYQNINNDLYSISGTKNLNFLTLTINRYTYNSFVGNIVVIDKSNTVYRSITTSEFNSLNLNYILDIPVSSYPLTIQFKNTLNETIYTKIIV